MLNDNDNSVFCCFTLHFYIYTRKRLVGTSVYHSHSIPFVAKHLSGNRHTMSNDIFHGKCRREHVLLGCENNFIVIQYWIPNSKRWLWAHVIHIDSYFIHFYLLTLHCKKKQIKPLASHTKSQFFHVCYSQAADFFTFSFTECIEVSLESRAQHSSPLNKYI